MADTYVSSGTVNYQLISSGSTMYVLSSGIASSTSVDSGGTQDVYDGGFAANTDLMTGGALYVGAGGAVSAVTDGGPSIVDVFSGGTATVVVDLGELNISSGAVIYSAIVLSGGATDVYSGGTAYSTTVKIDGYLQMEGVASRVVMSGGFEYLYGGVQSGAYLIGDSDLENVYGVDVGAVINMGAQIDDGPGALEYGASDYGYLQVGSGAVAADIAVGSGGTEFVLQDGTASGTVLSGGTLIVAGGANVNDVTIATGGTVISKGIAVYQGAGGTVVEASTLNGLIVSGYPETAFVLSGGAVQDLRLYDGAKGQITAGGTADDSVVSSGGELNVYSGSKISGTTLSGGTEINSGATAYATRIGSGGSEFIFSGAASGSVISSGGEQLVYGGAAVSATVSSGGAQYVDGLYAAATASNTKILAGGSEFVLDGAVTSNTMIDGGVLELANNAGSVTQGFASGNVQFAGSGGQLYLGSTNLPGLTISGFASGDLIDIDDLTYVTSDKVSVGTAGIVTLSVGGTDYELNISDATSHTPFELDAGYDGYGIALTENAPCFAAGTRILTPRGEIAVENLAIGDTVITSTGEDAAIVWIGRRCIDLTRHPKPETAQPVRIAAHAFAAGVPSRDLILSPDHALYLNDALIPAKALINQRNVRQLARPSVTYFHIELEKHSIIFAENCAVETYLETGNRGAFENAAGALTLHPDFAQTLREQQSCAPFVTAGPAVEAARQQTLHRHYDQRPAKFG